MPDATEADARINIDQFLREAGWDPADKQQVRTEVPITTSVMDGDGMSARHTDDETHPPKKADYSEGDARPVASFFSQRDLERLQHQRRNRKDLAALPIEEDYIRSGDLKEIVAELNETVFNPDQATA
jgi:type I site-specific restriction endonuclease